MRSSKNIKKINNGGKKLKVQVVFLNLHARAHSDSCRYSDSCRSRWHRREDVSAEHWHRDPMNVNDFHRKQPSSSRIEILLLKTNLKRGYFWQNITGSMEDGETPMEGAARELFEETGIRHHQGRFYDLSTSFQFYDHLNNIVLERLFLMLLVQKENPVIEIDKREHSDYRWELACNLNDTTYKYPSNLQAAMVAIDFLQKQTHER